MASLTKTRPMTFAEFEQLPETDRGLRYELRHGEAVEMAPPKYHHHEIQQNLRDLLAAAAAGKGRVSTELGFKLGESDYRIVDVAFLSRDRINSIRNGGYLESAPELGIEVISPSNTSSELRDKRKLCLENGSLEFWVVDPDHREIEITTPDGRSIIYKSGEQVPLFFAPGARLAVQDVFAPEKA